MGRRLPWNENARAISQTPSSIATATARNHNDIAPAKDQARHDSTISTGQLSAAPQEGKRLRSRSPSTSPPPRPPQISPLRPGYDNDDQYIMVEDEFWSVAQSYTAHLHHAEYKRLMQKAKERTPQQLADFSPSKPRDVRDKARRDALDARQRSALDAMAVQKVLALDSDEEELHDGVNDKLMKRKGDPWQGTNLAGLMKVNDRIKTSLVGLDKLPSSSRAAKGYGKGISANSQAAENNKSRDAMDIITAAGRRGRHGYDDRNSIVKDDQDERDFTWTKGSIQQQPTRIARSEIDSHDHRRDGLVSPSQHSSNKIKSMLARTKPRPNYLDNLENDSEEDINLPPNTIRGGLPVMKSTSKSAKDSKRDLRSRVDEVPVFMF